MSTKFFAFIFLSLFILRWSVVNATNNPRIDTPKEGDVLQGNVRISGSVDVPDFDSYQVAFSFDDNNNSTWYSINQGNSLVIDGQLALWDTTSITDGNYRLRLSVSQKGGKTVEIIIGGLRVRNYSPIETSTPPSIQIEAAITPTATIAPSLTVMPTPTRMPANPASISSGQIGMSLAEGGLLTVVIILVLGIYITIRRISRH